MQSCEWSELSQAKNRGSLISSKETVFIAFFLLFTVMAVTPSHCLAGQITIKPSLQVTGEYDDNILFSKDDSKKVSDFFTRIVPALGIGFKTERMELGLNANYNIRRYASDTQLNTDQWKVDFSTGYQFSEKFRGNIFANYSQDDTLDSELEETGLVTLRSERNTLGAGAGISITISELSYLSMSYAYSETNYDDPLRLDSNRHSLGLSYGRSLGEGLDTISISPSYSRNEDDTTAADNFSLSLGWSHVFSETSNLSASIGASYSEKKIKGAGASSSNDSLGWIGSIVYSKTGERYDYSVGFNQDVSFTITNDPIFKSRLFANYGYKISEFLNFGINGSILYSQSVLSDPNIDSQNVSITPSLSYRVSENGSLNFRYSYNYNNNDTVDINKDGDRHRVTLTYSYGFSKEY